jgi:Fe-S-cluster containining protein
MKIKKKEFITKYCIRKDILYENSSIKIYFMKVEKDRKCAFLDNRLCRIYEVRPIQCKRTPYNFFAYKKLWEYMPCVDNEKYIDGQSYNEDIELIRELLKGY